MNIARIALLLSSGFVLWACQRPQMEKLTRLQIGLPVNTTGSVQNLKINTGNGTQDVVSFSGETLKHALISISGSDFPTINLLWSHDEGSGLCNGTSCFIEVKSGEQRLIQFLGVYKSATGLEEFAYGDTTVNLNPGSQSVGLNLDDLALAGTTTEVTISGRYLTASNAGPTGKLEVYLHPVNGRPKMYFGSTHMYNGWFSGFGITGVKFEYLIQGLSIFEAPKSINEVFNDSLESQLRILFPGHYESYDSGQYRYRQNEIYFFGYFGPGVTNANKVCFQNASTPDPIPYKYTDATGSTPLYYESDFLSPTQARPHTTTNRSCGPYFPTSPISAEQIFVQVTSSYDFLRMNPPFYNTYLSPYNFTYRNGTLLDIRILPGITNALLSGFKAYAVPSANVDSFRINGPFDNYDCVKLDTLANSSSNGVYVLNAGTPYSVSTASSNSSGVQINLSQSITSNERVIVCAYGPDGKFFPQTVRSN